MFAKSIVNNDDDRPAHLYKQNFFDKKKNRKLAKIQPSPHFHGMIILVKKPLCSGKAWLPFQKTSFCLKFVSLFSQKYLYLKYCYRIHFCLVRGNSW